jgi:hypothetical protein
MHKFAQHAILSSAVGLFAMGCSYSPQTQFVADAHRQYEAAYLAGAGGGSPKHIEPRLQARGHASRSYLAGSSGAGLVIQHLETPYEGSPEWEREQAFKEARERQVQHSIRNVCVSC